MEGNVLPFGITSAPELFQRRISILLNGMPEVVCAIDDVVLIFGKSQAEHDTHLEAVLKHLVLAGVTLNPDKCAFSQKFLGHIVNSHLSKFIPYSAELLKPLTELLTSKRIFCWGAAQSRTFKKH